MSKSRLEFSQNSALMPCHLLPNELKCRTGSAETMKSPAGPCLWESTTSQVLHQLVLVLKDHREQGDCVKGLPHNPQSTKINSPWQMFKRSIKRGQF